MQFQLQFASALATLHRGSSAPTARFFARLKSVPRWEARQRPQALAEVRGRTARVVELAS